MLRYFAETDLAEKFRISTSTRECYQMQQVAIPKDLLDIEEAYRVGAEMGLAPEGYEQEGRVIRKDELQYVLRTMVFYNRSSGYMAFRDDKLLFFDGEVEGAVNIEIEELKTWIEDYDNHEIVVE